jgi:hypothetical protein
VAISGHLGIADRVPTKLYDAEPVAPCSADLAKLSVFLVGPDSELCSAGTLATAFPSSRAHWSSIGTRDCRYDFSDFLIGPRDGVLHQFRMRVLKLVDHLQCLLWRDET